MKSSDPHRARVVAEISIHDAIAAVEHFAANYPAERLSMQQAQRLRRAACAITRRVSTREFNNLPGPIAYIGRVAIAREILRDAGLEHLADDAPEGYGHGV